MLLGCEVEHVLLCPSALLFSISVSLLLILLTLLLPPLLLLLLATVPARKLEATGPVICMSVLSTPPQHHLLVVHEGSGAAVWDLRAQVLEAVLNPDDVSSIGTHLADVTTAAWMPGSSKGDFATGHDDGMICIWDLPAMSSSSSPTSSSSFSKQVRFMSDMLHQQQPSQKAPPAQLVSQLDVISSSSGNSQGRQSSRSAPKCRPVRELLFAAAAVECLAVFGGDECDRPDGLTLLPLPEPCQVSHVTRLQHPMSDSMTHWPRADPTTLLASHSANPNCRFRTW